MNFLAHLHLSPGGDLVRVGNFMADAVKGRDLSAYPDELAHGIRLHRAIDQFTDAHPEVRAFRRHFSPTCGTTAPWRKTSYLTTTWLPGGPTWATANLFPTLPKPAMPSC